jgi:ATP-dependent Zn protease
LIANNLFRFEKNEGIIVLAATNRRDYLDSALLRPGRFDSEIHIASPDLRGRKDIFELYISKIIHDQSVDTEYLAKGTTGFTGADIENMVNQVCLSYECYSFEIFLLFRLLCTLLNLVHHL